MNFGELWLIDPEEPSALVVRRQDDREVVIDVAADDQLTTPLLPGFGLRLRDLTQR